MGRELVRVPPNWSHPKRYVQDHHLGRMEERYQPMYHERTAQEAFDEWLQKYQAWLDGEHDIVLLNSSAEVYPKDEPYRSFCDWHGSPPDPEYYRPAWKDEERTWWQVWETVSEGTPVTPPFETRAELVEYLVTHGDFWDQRRRRDGSEIACAPWSRVSAEKFVYGDGWAPSLVVSKNGAVMTGVEALEKLS